MLRLHCRCGKKLKLADELLGKPAICPQCGKRVRVVATTYDFQRDRIDGLFVIESGPSRLGEQIFLGGKLAIEVGRGEKVALRLHAKTVHTCHARVIPSPYGWRVEEANADSPVLINGRRVRGHNLLDGDLLQIGEFGLRYFTDYTSTASRKLLKLETEAAVAAKPGAAKLALPIDFVAAQEAALLTEAADDGSVAPLAADSTAARYEYAAERAEVTEPAGPIAEPVSEPPHAPVYTEPIGKSQVPTPGTLIRTRPANVGEIVCPSCGKGLGKRARICVACGIDVITGKPLMTCTLHEADELNEQARAAANRFSAILPLGVYPFASDAFGSSRPAVARLLVALVVVLTGTFLVLRYVQSPHLARSRPLFFWAGTAPFTTDQLETQYATQPWADKAAFNAALSRLQQKDADLERSAAVIAAHQSLRPDQQPVGEFQLWQLLSHCLLNVDLLRFVGIFLFLLVFSARLNALIGNLWALVAFVVLAAAGVLAEAVALQRHTPYPLSGAGGLTAGLAGMYLVYFPVHKEHFVAWMRRGMGAGSATTTDVFTVPGYVLVIAFLVVDAALTLLGHGNSPAPWAHLAGLPIGLVLALLLLVARFVDARGGDIISVVLGRRAWAIVGRPGGAAS